MVQPLFGNVPLEALEILPAPGEPWHSFANARNQLAHGDQAAALRSAIGRKLVDGSPGDHLAAHLMWCHLEAGNERAAEAILLWARDLSSRTSSDPRTHAVGAYNLACFYARTGQAAEALPLLRESFEVAPDLKDWSHKDPDLDPIRDEPRIVELLGTPA